MLFFAKKNINIRQYAVTQKKNCVFCGDFFGKLSFGAVLSWLRGKRIVLFGRGCCAFVFSIGKIAKNIKKFVLSLDKAVFPMYN